MSAAAVAATGVGLVLAGATLLWAFSVYRRDASLADIAWGPGFAVLAWVYVGMAPVITARATWLAIAVTAWSARLAWHIASRHHGEDRRYRALRDAAGPAFWWRSLFSVFWLQSVLLWIIAAPLLAVTRDVAGSFRWLDAAGGLLILAGGTVEAVADAQLARFRRTASPGSVLDTGLWRYSRHPNYFGDAVLWWGVWLVACGTPAGRVTAFAPLIMTWLLVRVSGVALLDRVLADTKPAYREYMARTSGFVPWPPRRGSARPLVTAVLAVALAAPVVAAPADPAPMQVGDTFPALRGEYLSGRDARLPEDAQGRVAVVLMGFTYASRTPVELWAERLKPLLREVEGATFYEVPVIGGMARMGKWFIDSGMRRGTPKALHENVITVWGGTKQWKARVGVTDDRDRLAYVTLIDRDGRIRWRFAGPFDEQAFGALALEIRSMTAR